MNMVVKQLQFNEKVKISCTVFTLLHKKTRPKEEVTEKGLPFLRPEKKSQIFEKKIS